MNESAFSILGLPVIKHRFDSGLTLLLQPSDRVTICSTHIWVRAGSASDPFGRSGLAHFFEHLMFTGTSLHPEGELDHWVEENGGHINAATWLDWTYYHAEIPSSILAEFLDYEIDRLKNLTCDPERLERERQVVLNERREQVDDDPEATLSELLWLRALGGSGYSRPTIGSEADIKQLTRADCLAFYNRAYQSSNLVIAISGHFDAKAVIAKIQDGFSHPNDKRTDVHGVVQLNRYVPGAHGEVSIASKAEKLYVALPAPPLSSIDHAALEMVHHTLLEGESGRLQRLLVNELELASYAFGFLPSLSYDSIYEMGFDLRESVAPEMLLEKLRDALQTLLTNGISERELERARNRIELDMVQGLQTVEQRAHTLGFWEVVVGDCRLTESRLSEYASLDTTDVNAAINRWWSIDKLSWTIGRCEV